MVKINHLDFEKYCSGLSSLKIAVIGDVMLDLYYLGKTNRISPEAPVPVVSVDKKETKPGGAANVCLNLKTLGVQPLMFGITGDDPEGSLFMENMAKNGIPTDNILVEKGRPTTVKTRVLASDQHVVRFDTESTEDILLETENKLLGLIKEKITILDAVIFQDYNKGILTSGLIKKIIKSANSNNVLTAVDPKFKNFNAYKGATIFKPNLREAERLLSRKIVTEDDIEKAGRDLMSMLKLDKILITLSEKGMAAFDRDSEMEIIPARSAKISNVSGAGDTVIASLVAVLCAGATFEQACTIANYAASVAVEDVSIIPVHLDDLKKRLVENRVLTKSR